MANEKRELLLAEVQRVFADAVAGDTGGGTTWGAVLDSPYEGREKKGQNVMSVIEGTETYIDVTSPDKRDRRLEVDLTCMCYIPMGTTLRSGANRVLADMEQLIDANEKWGGHAYATFLLANSIVREDSGDRTVEVTLFMAVQYRTKRSNPRA